MVLKLRNLWGKAFIKSPGGSWLHLCLQRTSLTCLVNPPRLLTLRGSLPCPHQWPLTRRHIPSLVDVMDTDAPSCTLPPSDRSPVSLWQIPFSVHVFEEKLTPMPGPGICLTLSLSSAILVVSAICVGMDTQFNSGRWEPSPELCPKASGLRALKAWGCWQPACHTGNP